MGKDYKGTTKRGNHNREWEKLEREEGKQEGDWESILEREIKTSFINSNVIPPTLSCGLYSA